MAASSYAWLSVIVTRAVVPRKVVKIGWENNFGGLLTVIEPGFEKEVIDKVIVSTNERFTHYCIMGQRLCLISCFFCFFYTGRRVNVTRREVCETED